MATRLIQTGQEVQNILNNAIELFWAKYGETTYAEIDAAVASGALVACMHDSSAYFYSGIAEDNNTMVFSKFGASATPPSVDTILLNIGNNQWSEGDNFPLENVGNKIKTTDSHPEYQLESDDKYLSSKSTSQFFNRRASALQLTGGHVMYIHLGSSVTTDLPFYRVWYGDGTGAPYGEIIIELQKRLVSWTPPDAAEYAYAIKAINIGTTDSVAVSFVQASGYYWLKISVPSDGTRNAPFYVTASDGSEARVSQSCGGTETEIVAATVVNFASSAELANYMPKSGGRFSGRVIFEDRASFEGPLSLDDVQIHGLADPTNLGDAANKQYVDSGLATKASASDVSDINAKIPAQASAQNQLADKNFVNSSIQTNTATFRGTYGNLTSFAAWSLLEYGTPDNNDYATVCDVETSAWDADNPYQADEVCLYDDGSLTKIYLCIKDMDTNPRSVTPDEDTEYWKAWMTTEYLGSFVGTWFFKYIPNGAFDITNWKPEFQINEKPLTAEQLAALNSGITDTKVAKLDALPAKPVDTQAQVLTDAEKSQARVNIGALTSVSEQSITDPANGYYTKAQSDGRYVRFDGVQALTEAQKEQARENIGANGGSSATVIDTTGKSYLVFDWGTQNLGGSLLVTLKTSGGARNRSLILDLDVYGDYVAKASDLDGAAELLDDTDFVYDNGTGVGYLTINSDVKGATLRLLSGTLPAISAESSAPEYYDPASVPVAPYGDGKWGVISQTQTWSGSGSNPRTYTIDPDSIVRGIIPQANIDLFVAAGAEFDTETGYFKLNGLTDISYEEMQKIYAISFPRVRQFYLSAAFASSTARTNFCIFDFTELLGQSAFGGVAIPSINLAGLASFSLMEKISYTRSLSMTATVQIEKKCDSIQMMCSDAIYLREVEGVVQVQNISSLYRAFYHAYSLETIYLYKLKADVNLADSSLLSKDSLLYMINNSQTTAFTITLHASVYAKCQSGGEWYSDVSTALSAHTNVSLASA